MGASALSYYIFVLFAYDTLEAWSFWKTEGECSGGVGSGDGVVRDGRGGGGGNFGWDLFYERGIYYKQINKFQV